MVTKKTVFKWQEPFWQRLKDVFDAEYRTRFRELGLLDSTGGELKHLISDSATMSVVVVAYSCLDSRAGSSVSCWLGRRCFFPS